MSWVWGVCVCRSQSLPSRMGWLVSELQKSTCLNLASTGIISTYYRVQPFYGWVLGIPTQVPTLDPKSTLFTEPPPRIVPSFPSLLFWSQGPLRGLWEHCTNFFSSASLYEATDQTQTQTESIANGLRPLPDLFLGICV